MDKLLGVGRKSLSHLTIGRYRVDVSVFGFSMRDPCDVSQLSAALFGFGCQKYARGSNVLQEAVSLNLMNGEVHAMEELPADGNLA